MNINTLTVKAQEALQSALSLARERGQQAVEPLHILSVLVREDDSLATFLLGRVGVNVRGLRDEADRAVASLPRVEGGGDQFFSQDSSKVIQRAVDFTRNFGDKYASVEHLLLGLIAERGQAADILKRSGATEKELLEAIRTFRKGATVDSQTSEQQFDALGKYAINLNEQARSGKLDPVIGRDEEIRRVLQILSRRTKNNPILVGEAGVGKTAIAEGIAHRIVDGDVPEEIDTLDRRVRQLEIEREAIRREKDKERVEHLTKEIEELKARDAEMRAKWQGQRDLLKKIQSNKDKIEALKIEAQQAERQGDYGKVAEIRYGKIQEAEKEIAAFQEEYKLASANGSMIKEEVDAQDVAEVVSRWTGIPVTRMLASEREKLLHMEDELHKRVIGQEQAIAAISDAVRRSRAGLNDPRKPIGSFIFLGTTGVGKTELAKALAEFLFNDDSMMTRIDMSEYQERHSVSRLVGAPPGYVGYDEGGQLTEAVRRKPYSVVLLDEIEKAHPDVFNILLQVLDDGRLTDNKGRTVDFRNTIIIMTSNMGSQVIQENFAEAFNGEKLAPEVVEKTRRDVIDLLKQQLKPEFLNRIDEIVMFEPLTRKDIERIVDIQLGVVRRMLAENGIRLEYSEKAREWIAAAGYDPLYGARPVKRTIQRYVVNDLSKRILAGDVNREQPIRIDADDKGLTFAN